MTDKQKAEAKRLLAKWLDIHKNVRGLPKNLQSDTTALLQAFEEPEASDE